MGEYVLTMAEPVCSNALVHHNILVNAVKWTDVIPMIASMVGHVLLLLLMIFKCKDANVPSTMVVLTVTLTCVQELSVVVEHVLVEIVNVIQIMSTSKILVNKHVYHHRVRPRIHFNEFKEPLFYCSRMFYSFLTV